MQRCQTLGSNRMLACSRPRTAQQGAVLCRPRRNQLLLGLHTQRLQHRCSRLIVLSKPAEPQTIQQQRKSSQAASSSKRFVHFGRTGGADAGSAAVSARDRPANNIAPLPPTRKWHKRASAAAGKEVQPPAYAASQSRPVGGAIDFASAVDPKRAPASEQQLPHQQRSSLPVTAKVLAQKLAATKPAARASGTQVQVSGWRCTPQLRFPPLENLDRKMVDAS